jgi:hypothetical protein
MGHIGGIKLTIPSYLRESNQMVKKAPDIGSWVVIATDAMTSNRKRQLETLGYRVTEEFTKKGKFDSGQLDRLIANELTGNIHEKTPTSRSSPVF